MKTIIKRALALVLAVSTLLALVLLVSCGTKGAIEDFLTSDNYTFKAGKLTVKVDGATVYVNNDGNVKYLYYSKSEQRYFYCEVSKDGIINKESIDSEEYLIYHGQLVSTVANTSTLLTGFLQIADMLEDVDGVYTVDNYTVKAVDGVITCTVGESKATVSNVGSTKITIPNNVTKAEAR